MSDNVVKFRPLPKKPEPKPPRDKRPQPAWVPFAVLVAVAIVIYLVQQAGFLGG